MQEAVAARAQTHGYKLDKAHTFAVTLFDDFERYVKVPDQYQEYQPAPYKPTVCAVSARSNMTLTCPGGCDVHRYNVWCHAVPSL